VDGREGYRSGEAMRGILQREPGNFRLSEPSIIVGTSEGDSLAGGNRGEAIMSRKKKAWGGSGEKGEHVAGTNRRFQAGVRVERLCRQYAGRRVFGGRKEEVIAKDLLQKRRKMREKRSVNVKCGSNYEK